MDTIIPQKTCKRCTKVKNIEEFSKSKASPDGLQNWCRLCCQDYHKNPTALKRSRKGSKLSLQENHPPNTKWCPSCKVWCDYDAFSIAPSRKDGLASHCKQCTNIRNREIHYNSAKARDRQLQANYNGFTQEQYDQMFEGQCGVCACCGNAETRIEPRSKTGAIMNLCVDHDHDTGYVRGLLCGECNKALGILQEDVRRIQLLLAYAEKIKMREPLSKIVPTKVV